MGRVGADARSGFLIGSVTLGTLPHISGLQVFPHLQRGVLAHLVSSSSTSPTPRFSLAKREALSDHDGRPCQPLLLTGVRQPSLGRGSEAPQWRWATDATLSFSHESVKNLQDPSCKLRITVSLSLGTQPCCAWPGLCLIQFSSTYKRVS